MAKKRKAVVTVSAGPPTNWAAISPTNVAVAATARPSFHTILGSLPTSHDEPWGATPTAPAHFFGMYGMGGHDTDPNEAYFTYRVKHEFGSAIDCHDSPYGDFEWPKIVALIDALPDGDTVIVQGTSLGANNCPVVGASTKRKINAILGFQASLYGAHQRVTPNVLFAALFYSFNPVPIPGLGAYCWAPGNGFDPRRLHLFPHHIPHPGDYDTGDQNIFLKLIGRIIVKPE